MMEWISDSKQDTINLAKNLAKVIKKGDVFALKGTLGMGKSVFARAIIQELADAADVPSPTFTLVQTYQAKDFEIFHYDLYRLKNPEEIFELGMEEAMYNGVCFIEWPEKMGGYLPKDAFMVEFLSEGAGRKISICSSSPTQQERLKNL